MNRPLRYALIDLARGTHSLDLLRELEQIQFLSPEELEAQNCDAAKAYYRTLHESIGLFRSATCYADLPIIDKTFIREHRNQLMNPAYRGRLIRKKTGGSTGEPLIYYTGTASQSFLWASLFLAWKVTGWRLGERVAFLAGSALATEGLRNRIYQRLLNLQLLSAFDLSITRLSDYIRALEEGEPRLLYGYASAIHRLARFIIDSKLTPRTRLRAVMCTAEVMTPAMRVDIEHALGVPCFNQYGCNDAGVSAFECELRDGLHLITPRCFAEVLEDGRLIATDLSNTAMFLPRYDTGDRVRMSGRRCPCGRGLPLIEEVLGRQNDLVVDPNGAAVHSAFFNALFREDARIRAYQVVYDERSLSINVHVVSKATAAEIESEYRRSIEGRLRFPLIRFCVNQPFFTLPNAKHRYVMRHPGSNSQSQT